METYTIKEIVEKFGISENEMKYLMRKKSSNKNQILCQPYIKTRGCIPSEWSHYQINLILMWVFLQKEMEELRVKLSQSHKVK